MNEKPTHADEWARIIERLERMGAKASDHLALVEGDKVVVVFLGEPWAYEAAWHDERKQWVPIHRSPMPVEPALRIRINVYIPAIGRLKWWEMDTATFHALCACRDKYGLSSWMFEIEAIDVSADGACGEYSILPEEKLDATDLARIACRPLFQWGGHDDA